MARVMGSLYDDASPPSGPPTPAPAGVQIRLMQQDAGGVWRVKFKTNTQNANGDFDFPSVTSGDYRVRVQYPPDSTTPDRLCWATSPYPLTVVGTLVYADIYAPEAAEAIPPAEPRNAAWRVKREFQAAEPKKLRKDLCQLLKKGYVVALLRAATDPSHVEEVYVLDRDKSRAVPALPATGVGVEEYPVHPQGSSPQPPDDDDQEVDGW